MVQGAQQAEGDDLKDGDAAPARTRSLVVTLGGGATVGLVATLLYSLEADPVWQVLASSVMFAAASLAVGGLIGLLFGVPRTLGAEQQSAAPGSTALGTLPIVGANTNLEQISDWLTKIIVGVSLTQLGTIKDGAAALFNAMAPALGDSPDAAAFAGAIVVYFPVVGFFTGWLYARLRLGAAMSQADALLEVKRRATKSGDLETAQAAGEAAAATIRGVTPVSSPSVAAPINLESLATQYEQLRATMPSSPRRTAQMEELIRQARQLVRDGTFTSQDSGGMFQIGTEGSRIVALALMEGDIRLADFANVLEAIAESKSAFEQYHGLYVANLMVSSLGPEERTQLEGALRSGAVKDKMKGDPDRTDLAKRILDRLAESGEPQPPEPPGTVSGSSSTQ